MNKIQYLLVKLAEEASEISQIALKTAQFGVHEQCPGLNETNIQRIDQEFNDLVAIVELINQELNSSEIHICDAFIERKKEKVNKYYNYSIECGMVKG